MLRPTFFALLTAALLTAGLLAATLPPGAEGGRSPEATGEATGASVQTRPALRRVAAVSDRDLTGSGTYARVGYFPEWGVYTGYFVKNLVTTGAADKLTHLDYAFSNIDPVNLTCLNGVVKGTSPDRHDPDQGTGAADAEADYGMAMTAEQSVDGVADAGSEPLRGNFNQLRKLKAQYPNLKIQMSIGGWTYSKFFSDAAATDASRRRFVASCIDMYIRGNLPMYKNAGGAGAAAGIFDGIDLDWEWPGAPGHVGNHVAPGDKRNNTLLIAEFRRQLDALGTQTGKHYLLTAFTPASPVTLDKGWEVSGDDHVFRYLDFADIQGYDFHGPGPDNNWEPHRTGHHANWYADADDPYPTRFSADGAITMYTDAGVDPRRLTIGIPFYGLGWQRVADGGSHGEWQAADGAAPGASRPYPGSRPYNNLMATFPDLPVFHDEQALATFGYTGADGQWWTFDDAWSISRKMALLKQRGLLGAMIWEMSGDDGPLMTAVDEGLR